MKHKDEEEQIPKKPKAPRKINGPIVIVDDDAEFRKQIQDELLTRGYDVISLESGQHAIMFMQNQSWSWNPGLLITDLVMPQLGGYQLIRKVSELYPDAHIPVIVVSKLSTLDDVNEAEVAGAAAYIPKPLRKGLILETIDRVLAKDKPGIIVVYDNPYAQKQESF